MVKKQKKFLSNLFNRLESDITNNGIRNTAAANYAMRSYNMQTGQFFQRLITKSNLHSTRGITPKRVTSGGAHLRGLAPGQQSCDEKLQPWRAVGETMFGLTGSEIETKTYRIDSNVFNHYDTRPVLVITKRQEMF